MNNEDILRVKGDFRAFLWLIWKHLRLPNPTPVQYDMAEYLQHGPQGLIIQAFRGVGKSWVTAAYVCWLLLNDPELKIMVVSASKPRADAFSVFVKRLLREVPILQHLKPNPKNGDRDSNECFDVAPCRNAQSPSVKSVGITGGITGSRADTIIGDDVESLNNSYSQTQRDQLVERVKEFESVIKPGGRIIFLGTPQTQESIYNHLRTVGYKLRVWTAKYPEMNAISNYNGALAPFITENIYKDPSLAGQAVDPDRFDLLELNKREARVGRTNFLLQFMLDTTLSDADKYPLKLSDLIVMGLDKDKGPVSVSWCSSRDKQINTPSAGLAGDRFYYPLFIDEQYTNYTSGVLVIDPSGRGKDKTAYCILKSLHGRVFILDIGGLQGGYDENTLTQLALLAKDYSVNKVVIESNFGDGMFTSLFKPVLIKHHRCGIEEVRNFKQKEVRIIDTLEPALNSHRLVLNEAIIQKDNKEEDPNHRLFYQMTRLTKDRGSLKHDDLIDALGMGVSYMLDKLSLDTDKMKEKYEDDLLDKELRSFVEGVTGQAGRTSPSWVNSRRP